MEHEKSDLHPVNSLENENISNEAKEEISSVNPAIDAKNDLNEDVIPKIKQALGLSDDENIKSFIQKELQRLITTIEKQQNERNNRFLKLIEENPPKVDMEKLIRDFLSADVTDVLIDYSFILNSRVRRQLIVDNTLMEKQRIGLISGKPDFFEFCRSAHCQMEELLNYYYERRFKSIDDFNRHIESLSKTKTNEEGDSEKVKEPFKYVSECSYAQKHFFLMKEKGISLKGPKADNKYSSVRGNINNIRNKYLHRSSMESTADDEVIEKYSCLKNQIIVIKEKTSQGHEITNDEQLQMEEYKKLEKDYFIIRFRREENWDEVRNAIKNLIFLIKQDREKYLVK